MGGAVGHDNGVIPRSEAFFGYDRGWPSVRKPLRHLELTYDQHWHCYSAARIITVSGGTLAPVVELGGVATIILAALSGVLSGEFFLQFLRFGYSFATLISIGSVAAGRVHLQAIERWEGCRPTCDVLLPRTLLPSTTHDLAASGHGATLSGRYGVTRPKTSRN
jgi:hypothetical protein